MKKYVIYNPKNDTYLDKRTLGTYEGNICCYLIKRQDLKKRNRDLFIFSSIADAEQELKKVRAEHFFQDGVIKEFNELEELI